MLKNSGDAESGRPEARALLMKLETTKKTSTFGVQSAVTALYLVRVFLRPISTLIRILRCFEMKPFQCFKPCPILISWCGFKMVPQPIGLSLVFFGERPTNIQELREKLVDVHAVVNENNKDMICSAFQNFLKRLQS